MFTETRHDIVRFARRMEKAGLVKFTSGNISVRDAATGLVVITPTSLPYDEMEPEDLVVVNLDGAVVEGNRLPSSEHRLHLSIYRARPEVVSVVHTHSPYATALGIMNQEVPVCVINLAFARGPVPVAPFCLPGTWELGQAAVRAMDGRMAALLQNHGVVAAGISLENAFQVAIYVEEAARAYLLARQAGGPVTVLPGGAVNAILRVYLPQLAFGSAD